MSDYLLGESLAPGFLESVAFGLIKGSIGIHPPGRKDEVAVALLDDVTQVTGNTGALPDPGGIQLALKSTSALDTAAGTGVQMVRIIYLNPSGVQLTEDVILNGVTLVNTVALDIDKVQAIYTLTAGSGGVAAGDIILVNVGNTISYEMIASGGNQSLSCRYHVPAGKTAYIIGWDTSAVAKRIDTLVDFRLRATVDPLDRDVVSPVFLFQDVAVLNNGPSGFNPFAVHIKCPALSSVKVSAQAETTGINVGCSMGILIRDNVEPINP